METLFWRGLDSRTLRDPCFPWFRPLQKVNLGEWRNRQVVGQKVLRCMEARLPQTNMEALAPKRPLSMPSLPKGWNRDPYMKDT